MKYKYITSIVSLVILFSLGSLSLIKEDNVYSEAEGRKLKMIPEKEEIEEYEEKIGTGKIQSEWDTYFSDQMVGRSYMVNAYTKMQKTIGKKKINDVYLADNGYLISKSTVEETDKKTLIEKANYYDEMSKRFERGKMYLVNVPHKIMVHEEEVPIVGYEEKGNEYMDILFSNVKKAETIDLRDIFKKEDSNYYKTDHHLNMNGVYDSYKYIINSLSKDFKEIEKPLAKKEFKIKKYENYFLGSDGRKVNSIAEELEDIEIYNHKIIDEYKTNIKEIYREEKLTKDKLNNDYTVYLGGDNPKVEIENKNAKNNLKIAIIGDSIDNPLVPLIGMHFNKTYNYDLRHYKGNIIEEINNKEVDVVILIALSNNFILGNKGTVFNFEEKKNG
ncbi:MAG: DHHW family protein [Clostridium sp.]